MRLLRVIVKNFSRVPDEEIYRLVKIFIQLMPELNTKTLELHVKQYPGKRVLGLGFKTLDLKDQDKKYKRYLKSLAPTTKQLAIVYVIKKKFKEVYINDISSWQEAFIAGLSHELRHLWHARNKGEENDCKRTEKRAVEKYREYKRLNKINS